jgi:hypothetical protein
MPPRRRRGVRLLIAAVALSVLAAAAAGPAAAAAGKPGLRCTIKGSDRDDRLRGTAGPDVICAGAGNDTVMGMAGADRIRGGPGKDRIEGGRGDDELGGDRGDDILDGGSGRDDLYGDEGDDELAGGPGGDALYGDLGDDRHFGGPGIDHVSGGPGRDTGDPMQKNGVPDCPSTASLCEISIHLDIGVYCPGYSSSLATCWGRTPYSNQCWDAYVVSLPGLFGQFSWFGQPRHISYNAVNFGPVAKLEGSVPSTSSAAFTVDTAYCVKWQSPGTFWETVNKPGQAPGTKGGPLYLNFRNGYVGADVYIDGYLSPRR